MKKSKTIRFFTGIIVVVFLAIVITTFKVSFFDCKYGQCFVKECVDTDKLCEANNDQGYYDCCYYDTREIPFRDYLIKQIMFYGLICGSGLGIALGAFLADRGNKIPPSQSSTGVRTIISDPMPITFWERFKDKLKRYLP
jgi:hypothetical protein